MLHCTYGCNSICFLRDSESDWLCRSVEHALLTYYDITLREGLVIITPR